MKKNLMSVLIMALVFVNVVLSAVIMITLVPAAKQSNELITKVSSAIELELEGGKVYNANTIPVDNTSVRRRCKDVYTKERYGRQGSLCRYESFDYDG